MRKRYSRVLNRACAVGFVGIFGPAGLARGEWIGYAGDPQHTALSAVESQPFGGIRWQTEVDTDPPYAGSGYLLVHYGSPAVTAANTVIVPVNLTPTASFEIRAFDGATGDLKWVQPTDYTLPPPGSGGSGWPAYNWTPTYNPALAPGGTLYYAGAGGTVYSRSLLDSNSNATPTQQAFYGMSYYQADPATLKANIAISTPITSDNQGNIYFGYQTSGTLVLSGFNGNSPLTNGIARISSTGVTTYFQAKDLDVGIGGLTMHQVAMNSAPALSNDGSTVYVTMSNGNSQGGRIVALNSTTLAPITSRLLLDPITGFPSPIPNDSTAAPMVGPDGDVYMGAVDSKYRGWLSHFSGDLSVVKPTGGFGWDVTPSVVPSYMVPSYHGTSPYLLMTKYNNYAFAGGDNMHMVAILDPNDTEIDPRQNSTGALIMKAILTQVGPTPDGVGVREWCINTAVVDPATNSVIVNNEDGKVYRWDLVTNTLSEVMTLTAGIGEAYTPTFIGANGAVYAINDATLFSVGVPTQAATWNSTTGNWSEAARWSSSPTVPHNGTPATAWYDVAINGGTVNLDVNTAIHALNFTGGTLGGSANLTLSNGTINGTYLVSGMTSVSGRIVFNGSAHQTGGITGTGAAVVSPGVTITSDGVTIRTLAVDGTLIIRPNGADTGASRVYALGLAGTVGNWTGKIDLNDNALIVQAIGSASKTSAITMIKDALNSGRNNGTWNGTGITSSTILTTANTTLVLADNADLHYTQYRGQSVDVNSLIIVQAHFADATLDDKVDSFDLNVLAANWQQPSNGLWSRGDFTGPSGVPDGITDSFDLNMLAAHWQYGVFDAALFPQLAAVPEPASVLLLGLTLPLLLRRRAATRR